MQDSIFFDDFYKLSELKNIERYYYLLTFYSMNNK